PAAIHACSGHEQGREKQRYALIILNQPLIGREWFENVWNSCDLRICADGGANRLFDGYIPHHIAGDLDSLRPPVRAFYESRGTHVHAFSDQDSTDLGKCVAVVRELPPHTLILLPALSGRFDHVMASIQTVYEIQ
ncbi:Thiamin pyrophosphokinase, partial [Gonapodya prolifera JEL478]